MFNHSLQTWLRGIWGAIISGGTSGVIAGISLQAADPDHFSFGMPGSWKTMGVLFGGSAFVSLMKFLNAQPAPPPDPPAVK